MNEHRRYLGDGIYVRLSDRGDIVLITAPYPAEDGTRIISNTVYLSPSTWRQLVAWWNEVSSDVFGEEADVGG